MILLWHGKDQIFVFINVSVEGCVRDPNRFFVFFSSGFPPHMGSRERFFPGASNGDLILSTCSNLVRATLAFSEKRPDICVHKRVSGGLCP